MPPRRRAATVAAAADDVPMREADADLGFDDERDGARAGALCLAPRVRSQLAQDFRAAAGGEEEGRSARGGNGCRDGVEATTAVIRSEGARAFTAGAVSVRVGGCARVVRVVRLRYVWARVCRCARKRAACLLSRHLSPPLRPLTFTPALSPTPPPSPSPPSSGVPLSPPPSSPLPVAVPLACTARLPSPPCRHAPGPSLASAGGGRGRVSRALCGRRRSRVPDDILSAARQRSGSAGE